MLDLTNTTLLFVETRAHKITARVIEDCLRKVDFGEIVVYTDKPELIPAPNFQIRRGNVLDDAFKVLTPAIRYIPCVDFPNKKLAGEFYYGKAMEAVTTDFALMLEWDGGIFDPKMWHDEFFDFDYIGAPWPDRHTNPHSVGNGGFTLMSKRLGHFIIQNTARHSVATDMDVARKHRGFYEENGFKWPEPDLASFFSWELGPRNPDHFGYHGVFNWPALLERDELIARASLMLETEYLLSKIQPLIRVAPWLMTVIPDFERRTSRYPVAAVMPDSNARVGVHAQSPQQRAAMQLAHIQRAGNRAHLLRNQTGLKA